MNITISGSESSPGGSFASLAPSNKPWAASETSGSLGNLRQHWEPQAPLGTSGALEASGSLASLAPYEGGKGK